MALLPLKDDNNILNIKFQYITLIIIVSCITVFIWQLSLGEERGEFIYGLGTIPSVLFGDRQLSPNLFIIPESVTLLTSLFLHGGWMHLTFNMLFLWVFGDNIEDSMGHLRFISFYLICGILATLTHSIIESNSSSPLIGASGAISGVLGAYLVIHPKARILVLFMNIIPLRLPAIIVLGSWIGIQFFSLGNETNTAWWAHIGGFAAGMALIIPFRKKITTPNKRNFFGKGKNIVTPQKARKKRPSIFPKTLKK